MHSSGACETDVSLSTWIHSDREYYFIYNMEKKDSMDNQLTHMLLSQQQTLDNTKEKK